MNNSTTVPESNRIVVKLDASIDPLPNARRHSIELAANAIKASPVRKIVLNKESLITASPL